MQAANDAAHLGHPHRSLIAVLFQALQESLLQLQRHGLHVRRPQGADRRGHHPLMGQQHLGHGVGGEGEMPGQKLVGHHAVGVEVTAGVHRLADDLLRGDVGGRPEYLTFFREGLQLGLHHDLGQPEIEDLDPILTRRPLGHQDVRRLQIPVHHPRVVGCPEAVRHLGQDLQGAGQRQRPALVLVHQRLQIPPLEVLHHQVEPPVPGVPEVRDGDEVGVAHPARGQRLAPEALHQGPIPLEVAAEHLDRIVALKPRVVRAVHLGHGPLAEPLQHAKAPRDHAPDHLICGHPGIPRTWDRLGSQMHLSIDDTDHDV